MPAPKRIARPYRHPKGGWTQHYDESSRLPTVDRQSSPCKRTGNSEGRACAWSRSGLAGSSLLRGFCLAQQMQAPWPEGGIGEDLKPLPVQLGSLTADEAELDRDRRGNPHRDPAGAFFRGVFPTDEEPLLSPQLRADHDFEVREGPVVNFIFRAIAIDQVSHALIVHDFWPHPRQAGPTISPARCLSWGDDRTCARGSGRRSVRARG